jgi:hypothetical protein
VLVLPVLSFSLLLKLSIQVLGDLFLLLSEGLFVLGSDLLELLPKFLVLPILFVLETAAKKVLLKVTDMLIDVYRGVHQVSIFFLCLILGKLQLVSPLLLHKRLLLLMPVFLVLLQV